MIAIDGPAASGKSTVGRMVADALGFLYLDTGVLYRALTWKALEQGVEDGDDAALAELAMSLAVEIGRASVADGRQEDILVDGQDVSLAIRSPAVDAHVSAVSAHPSVRTALVDVQRRVAHSPGTVVVGRDIGTVIFPDATLKVYLVANPAERARRRLAQRGLAGADRLDVELEDVLRRDRLDSSREAAPLRRASDAVELDTTGITPEEVVARILALYRGRERQSSRA